MCLPDGFPRCRLWAALVGIALACGGALTLGVGWQKFQDEPHPSGESYHSTWRFKLGAALAGIGLLKVMILCTCPYQHPEGRSLASNVCHSLFWLAVKLALYPVVLYFVFTHPHLVVHEAAQGGALTTIFVLILVLGFYGACLRHALALLVTAYLGILALPFLGWAVFSAGFGAHADAMDEKTKREVWAVCGVCGAAIVVTLLASITHALHGHRMHAEHGTLWGKRHAQATGRLPTRA